METDRNQAGRHGRWLADTTWTRPDWPVALLITLAAACLHFAFLSHAGGFWRDEVNTINLAGRPLGEMAKDSFPILMPSTVRTWSALGLGASDRTLRLLGVLIGLGILVALWGSAWVGKRSPPMLSLALLGLNATVITYGDSLRPFGLGSLMVVVLIAAMWAFLEQPCWKRAALLAAAAILSVQVVYQNAVLLAAICAGGWCVCWRLRSWSAAGKILVAALAAVSSLLPYLSNVLPLLESSPASGVAYLRTEFRPALAFGSLSSALGFPLPLYTAVWVLIFLAVVGFAVAAWYARSLSPASHPARLEPEHARIFAGTTLLAAWVGFAGFLWFARLRTEPWYFLPPMALTAVCFELGLPAFRRPLALALLGLVAITALADLPFAWRDVRCRFTNIDQVAKRLAGQASLQDFIIVAPWNRGISFERYFKARTPWDTVPPLTDHSTHRYDLVQRQTQAKHPMGPIFERITTALKTGHRVWMAGTVDIPPAGIPLPKDLSPPPRKHTGWSPGPYVRNWTAQTAQFISNHSLQFSQFPLPATGPVNANETLELFVAEGWKD